MSQPSVIEEAKGLLSQIEPLHLTEITDGTTDVAIGSLRGEDGFTKIHPHVESQTMLVAERGYFDFIVDGPRIMADLVKMAENLTQSAKNNDESSRIPTE